MNKLNILHLIDLKIKKLRVISKKMVTDDKSDTEDIILAKGMIAGLQFAKKIISKK